MHAEQTTQPLVDFLIVGAQKAGTTSLFDALNKHPHLSGSTPKEPHFFSTSSNWEAEINKYHQHFNKGSGIKCFDGSTSYAFAPLNNLEVWRDIYNYNPTMRIIYSVRNPIDRIVSSYMMYREKGLTKLSLTDAVLTDRHYIDASRYSAQIMPYIRQFGEENVLILNFTQLTQDLSSTLQKVALFLNIDPEGFPKDLHVHTNKSLGKNRVHYRFENPNILLRAMRKWAPSFWNWITHSNERLFTEKPLMPAKLQQTILDQLEPDIIQLEKLLGEDLTSWRDIRKPS